ncbi:transcriptional regulator, MerR family [Deferribacter desulfuricans SSM1]|uniref:Transcriptional regulator, MerR family n=1 Tax=Deferribacter desulfuricans (strain DSM 14783 / JCM 11476 / NBRC 101012 / SSM1) TaxID=639282 RepID=D3P9I7_DEFDS|nr:helix-turn-helix transcriptional regulator [Deferribacter desulfuricans]BAI81377.1 transcriptional regulator, MerR family [Deferribacter desulfuricans SSM1]
MRKKPLYVISIVSEMLDIHPQTLRQYERLGFIKPTRTEGNTRLYSDEDIEKLKFIITLTKDLGVNLAGVEIILNMREQINELQSQVRMLLDYIKNKLGEDVDKNLKEGAIVPTKKANIIKVKIEKE